MENQIYGRQSADPLRGHLAVTVLEQKTCLQAWFTRYLSLHVHFTTLIHALSNICRGLNAAFMLPCQSSHSSAQCDIYPPVPVFTQLGQPSPAHSTPIQDHSQPGQPISRESVQPNQKKNAKNSKKRLRNGPIFGDQKSVSNMGRIFALF